MKAIVVTDEAAGTAGMTLVERPEPPAAESQVLRIDAGTVLLLEEAVAQTFSVGRAVQFG
jgi:hypothetical protein